MKKFAVLLAGASLFACAQEADQGDETGAAATPAALTYDGADYGDDQAAMLAHGERLSKVLLCAGCHMADFTGRNWGEFDEVLDGLYASNLTHVVPEMDDDELRMLLVKGVHPDRGEMYVMPAKLYQHLDDRDLDALIAFLRTLEPTGEPTPKPVLNEATLAAIEAGELTNSIEDVARHGRNRPLDLGAEYARGKRIAMTTCAECHGPTLSGEDDFAPNLDIAASYDHAALSRLLTTGEGIEGSELDLMAEVGRDYFSHFTDAERAAVVAYVKARADANLAQ